MSEDESKGEGAEPAGAGGSAEASTPAPAPGSDRVPAEPLPLDARAGELVFPIPPPTSAEGELTPAQGEPASGDGEPAPPEAEAVLYCVLCGSTSVRESEHLGFAALVARASGATVFTCLSCRHRFAVRLFERIHRRHRRRDGQRSRDRRIRLRRRLLYWIWILLGAVLTASAVYYFLERDTQRSLTPPDSSVVQ